jgi:hypothetical protein
LASDHIESKLENLKTVGKAVRGVSFIPILSFHFPFILWVTIIYPSFAIVHELIPFRIDRTKPLASKLNVPYRRFKRRLSPTLTTNRKAKSSLEKRFGGDSGRIERYSPQPHF